MSTLHAVARYLVTQGLGMYDPAGGVQSGDWSVFLEAMPDAPDRAIALYQYPGEPPDPLLPFDEIRIQVSVRGGEDPTVSRDRAQAIYGQMHGLGPLALPTGLWLQLCLAVQSGAVALGTDGNGRHTHVVNLNLSITNPTAHRPAL